MAINSRAKGKAGELELAKILRETYGFEDARRSQQFSGKQGDADVVGLPHLHLEVKRNERLNIYDAYEQSCRDEVEIETVYDPIIFTYTSLEKAMKMLAEITLQGYESHLKLKYEG